jgi:hypothetical protein
LLLQDMFHAHGAAGSASSSPSLDPGGAAPGARKRSFLSGAEIARLRELEHQFLTEAAKRGPSVADRLATSAYVKENEKIRRALSLRGESGSRLARRLQHPAPRTLKSTAMDNLLFLERLEAQAAIVIQRAYRRYQRIVFWARYNTERHAAIEIQRVYRGHCGRRAAFKYRRQRELLAVKCQAVARSRSTRDKAQAVRTTNIRHGHALSISQGGRSPATPALRHVAG